MDVQINERDLEYYHGAGPVKYTQEPLDGLAIKRLTVGNYAFAFTPSTSGRWLGTWQGTGTVAATHDFTFTVSSSEHSRLSSVARRIAANIAKLPELLRR
jgi:hypothetical protein